MKKKTSFLFDLGIIWGRFRHRTSILFSRKVEMLWILQFFFDPKIDFLFKKRVFDKKRIGTGIGRNRNEPEPERTGADRNRTEPNRGFPASV